MRCTRAVAEDHTSTCRPQGIIPVVQTHRGSNTTASSSEKQTSTSPDLGRSTVPAENRYSLAPQPSSREIHLKRPPPLHRATLHMHAQLKLRATGRTDACYNLLQVWTASLYFKVKPATATGHTFTLRPQRPAAELQEKRDHLSATTGIHCLGRNAPTANHENHQPSRSTADTVAGTAENNYTPLTPASHGLVPAGLRSGAPPNAPPN